MASKMAKMPLISEVEALFSREDAPYELAEVVDRLRARFGPVVSAHGVYRALQWLGEQSATAPVVAPLNPKATPRLYSCEGARRIARRAMRGKRLM